MNAFPSYEACCVFVCFQFWECLLGKENQLGHETTGLQIRKMSTLFISEINETFKGLRKMVKIGENENNDLNGTSGTEG